MAWEIFNYPGGLTEQEQASWFYEIGLLDHFDLSGSTAAANKPLLSYFNYRRADAGSDTISFQIMTSSYLTTTDNIVFKKMVFDTGAVLWDIHEQGSSDRSAHVTFFANTSATTIDDSTVSFVYATAVSNDAVCTATRVILTDKAELDQAHHVSNAYWYESRNQGSVKYILQPFYIGGIRTGFYTVDGGQNRLAYGAETIIQNKKIFVMNNGLGDLPGGAQRLRGICRGRPEGVAAPDLTGERPAGERPGRIHGGQWQGDDRALH